MGHLENRQIRSMSFTTVLRFREHACVVQYIQDDYRCRFDYKKAAKNLGAIEVRALPQLKTCSPFLTTVVPGYNHPGYKRNSDFIPLEKSIHYFSYIFHSNVSLLVPLAVKKPPLSPPTKFTKHVDSRNLLVNIGYLLWFKAMNLCNYSPLPVLYINARIPVMQIAVTLHGMY